MIKQPLSPNSLPHRGERVNRVLDFGISSSLFGVWYLELGF
jgi:hypothetical protein